MAVPSNTSPSSGPRVVVSGFLGLFTTGGATWDYLQYALALHQLGCDVLYLEDTRLWPVYQEQQSEPSAQANVESVRSIMASFGLQDRWAYRDEVSGQCFGKPIDEVESFCRTADALINVSCALYMRDEYRDIPVRALIDSDPMFTQLQCANQLNLSQGTPSMQALLDAHTHHFTFGLNLSADDCLTPDCGLTWLPTLQPLSLDHWPQMADAATGGAYTTVMNWKPVPPIEYDGRTWGQKDEEFDKIVDAPQTLPAATFELTVNVTDESRFPRERIAGCGWGIRRPQDTVANWQDYRQYLQGSRGEFSVAKHAYVAARTGWFSCRTACYLASGRPAVVQDTGWSRALPSGMGLIAFDDAAGAIAGIEAIESDYATHAQAARAIAEEFFDGRRVLADLLRKAGVTL